jgi:xanthine dehydrogenase YagS FAD-binding subunit
MMRAFEYANPKSKEQAVALLGTNWDQASVLAGGVDLLGLMKDDVLAPKRVVNIKGIGELYGERRDSQSIRIGALATLGRLAEAGDIQRDFPALAEALIEAASPQIRNVATLGGNLCQRPRCWYFRSGFGLLPKTDSGKSMVLEGDNRYHAILGNQGPAYFVSPSSIAPALIAYNARVRLWGPGGTREIALEKFFVIPQAEGEREHDLRSNEILTEVVVPHPGKVRSAHYEVRQKAAFDWPLAVVAVSLTMQGDTVQSARVVMGHVAPQPWVSQEAARALVGKPLNPQTAEAAGEAAVAAARSLGRNGYKIQLARVAVKRALLKAGGAGGAA